MWLVFALSASVCFGVRGSLYQWSSQQNMNRSLMLCGVFSTGAILGALLSFLFRSDWTLTTLVGMMMGLFSFIASMAMYRGFAVGKASIVAVLTGMPPIVVVLLAFILWGERLSIWQLLAFIVIVAGILMIRYSSDLSFKQLRGAGWGLLCMLFFGLNDMTSKLSTKLGADLLPTMFFMFATGTVCFFIWYRLELWQVKKQKAADILQTTERTEAPSPTITIEQNKAPWSNSRTFGWGMLVGTTNVAGMILILNAFQHGVTGLVSAVITLNVAIILLYSRLYLKERFTHLEVIGIAFAFGGIVMLRLFEMVQ